MISVRSIAARIAKVALHLLALSLLVACPARAADELRPQMVADGVYAFVADTGEISAANRGDVGNSGFIVGPTGVVVIDTGISYRHGRRMLAAVGRVTAKPVELVVITHAVQEFLFGNAAFEERGVSIVAHSETTALMKARCAHCLENLRPVLGNELEGTRLVLPQRQVTGSSAIEAGGRMLELIYLGWASTPGDLAVFDRATGTLFGGGMVALNRIPEIRDCDFEGWTRALDMLRNLPVKRVVPGHGPVSGPEAIRSTADYLRDLDQKIKALYARSSSLLESVDNAALPAYAAWAMYATTHRQNALHRYLQLEIEELGGDPRSTALPQR
ncbi:MAG TPA: MBL fold metallo-hydrolase [Burkholderiales bacterium]|nr:MBL fold metallo-hydrolase [Burkholderiales bacterium]